MTTNLANRAKESLNLSNPVSVVYRKVDDPNGQAATVQPNVDSQELTM